jgi:hypothetical protein
LYVGATPWSDVDAVTVPEVEEETHPNVDDDDDDDDEGKKKTGWVLTPSSFHPAYSGPRYPSTAK